MELKTCTKCNKTKGIHNFYINKRSKGGRRAMCKDCARKYNRRKRGCKTRYKKVQNLDCSYRLKDQYILSREMLCVTIDNIRIPLDIENLNDETCEYLISNGYRFLFKPTDPNKEKIIIDKK